MAKRFTDTDKWKKPFIKSLPASYKLFWLFLTDDINHAGIWEVDTEIAQLRIGTKVDINKAIELFKDKIVVFDEGTKWFIPDFILFQYGTELNAKNKVHLSVLRLLNKYNLMGHLSPLLGVKDKDKDKDIVSNTVLIEKVKEKKELFKNKLMEFNGKYSPDVLNGFYRYWTEATPDMRFLKWELEDTWELKLRLITWSKNDLKFNK